MAESSRDRIIRSAHDLFYRLGFHAVGIDAIIAEVGVTKTTFYNHFASKDDLIPEVLKWHDQWWQRTFREMLRRHGGDAPLDQLRALPDALAELFREPGYNGCFFVNVAVQFPQPHDPAHQAAAHHKRAMEAIIREIAGYAGFRNAAEFAEECALIMEGAYVTEQVTGNPRLSEVVRRMMEASIDRHVVSAVKRRA